MGFLRAIPHRDRVQVLLIRDTSDATERLRGTLRTLGLDRARINWQVEILNDSRATPGALHKIRHLVAVRADIKYPPASPRARAHVHPAQELLPMTGYKASGGDSALYDVDGWPVRAEAHAGAFAMVWPARTSLRALVSWLRDHRVESAGVRLGGPNTAVELHRWAEATLRIEQAGPDEFTFARIDLPHLVVTWSPYLRQLPVNDETHAAAEIGIGAEQFDQAAVAALVEGTGVTAVAERAQAIAGQAGELLADVPRGHVGVAA